MAREMEILMHPNHTTNDIPYGFCQCGCGQKTNVAKITNSRLGHIKGQHVRFIRGHGRTGRPGPRRPAKSRFWEKVDKRGPDDCWEWQAAKTHSGYGAFRAPNGMHPAHRYSYELHHGPIPDGMVICHKCDNPPCVNPIHLFLGTDKDNVADMLKKGRNGDTGLKGEANHKSKLSAEQVQAIRQRAAKGETLASLAREYGMSDVNIGDIVRRRTWRHI